MVTQGPNLSVGVDRVAFRRLRHQLKKDGPVTVDGLVKETLALAGWLRGQQLDLGDEAGVCVEQVMNCPGEELGGTLN